MNNKSEQIFSCDQMNWSGLRQVFLEMSNQAPPSELTEESLMPTDLAVMQDHIAGCDNCTGIFVALQQELGLTSGNIYPPSDLPTSKDS